MLSTTKRFRVAFSFAGEKRDFVAQMADLLAMRFGKDVILYDQYHEAEFARPDLGIYLPKLYGEQSDLVVPVLCPNYDHKRWTGWEWLHIYGLLTKSDGHRVMPTRFEHAVADGLSPAAGFIELDNKTADEAVKLILQRLALNEGKPANHYIVRTDNAVAPSSSRANSIVPVPPAFYAAPIYVKSHDFVGRDDQLNVLSDWASPNDPHPILLFEAIGGMGKSMLTWEWVNEHSTKTRQDWAGRFWYSFYEKGAIMADFCQHALAYMTGTPLEELKKKKTTELTEQLLFELQARPWLLVLDGLERILVAYHRFDAAQLADDQVDTTEDQMAKRDPRAAIRPEDDDLLRTLSVKGPSKILITTRLTPSAFVNRSDTSIAGVQRELLRGLRPVDAEQLFRSCEIRGNSQAIQDYLQQHCACHPLVVGALAGIIRKKMRHRGNFDTWAADNSAGSRLNFANLNLNQKQNHILHSAIVGLPKESLELLSILALIPEAVDIETLIAFNPHLPPEPKEPLMFRPYSRRPTRHEKRLTFDERQKAYEEAVENRLRALPFAEAKLEETVVDLQERGLLQYDTQSNRYDLHPVVRSVIFGLLKPEEKVGFGERVVDHFSQQSHNPYEEAETLEDLRVGLHIVRTRLHMGYYIEAYNALVELIDVLMTNLEAYSEVLNLLRPFFPMGWGVLPEHLSEEYFDADEYINLASYAARALWLTYELDEAVQAYSVLLSEYIESNDWANVAITLSSLAPILHEQNFLALATQVEIIASDIDYAIHNDNAFHYSQCQLFQMLIVIGQWRDAEAMWPKVNSLDDNGAYAAWYAFMKFWQGELKEDVLIEAEQRTRSSKYRRFKRYLHILRGEWHMSRDEWEPAYKNFHDAVQMAREVRIRCEREEILLILAKFHLGQLVDPRHEAERFVKVDPEVHRVLALLWYDIGDHEQAKKYALSAYKWAWADGEPYVNRYALNQSAALLEKLGVPIPEYLPYDSSKAKKIPHEDELRAALEKLRAEKAQEEADETEGK